VNNLPKVVTQRCPEQDLNLRPTYRKPKCLTVTPPRHPSVALMVCCLCIGGNSVEVKTEADDITEYSHDDLPSTGVFGLYLSNLQHFALTYPCHIYCIM